MKTLCIRIFKNGYLVAKHYCKENEVENFIFNYNKTHEGEFKIQVSELGK